MCLVPFSIAKHYAEEIVYDVMDIDAYHISLAGHGSVTTMCFAMVKITIVKWNNI